MGVTEKGEILFFPLVGRGLVHLSNALRVPMIKNNFTGLYARNSFVIAGESYELADVTKSQDYSEAIIARYIFLPLKKVWDDLITSTAENPVTQATITIDGTTDTHQIGKNDIPEVLGTLAEAAGLIPGAEQDIMNLINDPNIYVPVSVDITNPHWGGGIEE